MSFSFCCPVSVTLVRRTTPPCPPLYTVTVKNRLDKALAAGTRVRVQADDPTLTAFRTCLFANDGTTVSHVCVQKGVLTFALVREVRANGGKAVVEVSGETVNVDARASTHVVLRAYVDDLALVCAPKSKYGDAAHCLPVASKPLCVPVDVLDDCALAPSPPLTTGNVYYVVATGVPGSGCSWASPRVGGPMLSTTLDFAQPGDQVWVAKGTYTLTDATFTVRDGVQVYGGFAGTERALCERCIGRASEAESSGTILSRSGSGPTVDMMLDAVLDGFEVVVSGGQGTNIGVQTSLDGLATIRHVIVRDGDGSEVGIDVRGGAVVACDLLVTNCLSGIRINNGRLFVDGGRIQANQENGIVTSDDIGGLASLHDVAVVDNGENGIVLQRVYLYNCTVARNGKTAPVPSGSGVFVAFLCAFNSIIVDNAVTDVKGLGMLANVHLTDTLVNTLVDVAPAPVETRPKRGNAGFVDAAAGNYQLKATSQALDCGDNGAVRTLTDAAGRPRIVGARVDLGAYERQAPNMCDADAPHCDGK